ncbi:hypothetical protein H8356DRAFT_1060701 [Neocallimastix lanati (nom. inval.)]|nr:hypothetical protein H8356DRAFT_1060701 [Neocallimastix sp. JGI-2020a]
MLSLLFIAISFIIASSVKVVALNTYESLNIDAAQKQQFKDEIIKDSLLPVINISTRNNTEHILSRETYTECVVDAFNVSPDLEMKENSAKIRIRGNSSAYYGDIEKILANPVPYKIKFDEKTSFLGLHEGEKFNNWVLIKSNWDIIRIDIALKMGRTLLRDEAFCTDSQLVNLYVNDVFQGIYVLTEQYEVDEKRVNVSPVEKNYNGTDIGYFIEIDNCYEREPHYFNITYEDATVTDINGVSRKFIEAQYTFKNDIYSQEQVDFIGNYTENLFKIIYYATKKNDFKTFDENYNLVNATFTSAEETIKAVVDIDSFVDMYILYEIVHDYDVGEGSFFFAIDFSKNSKIPKFQMTAPWDFDWTYNDSNEEYWAGTFQDTSFTEKYGDRTNPWFVILTTEPWFYELVCERWQAVSNSIKNDVSEEYNYSLTMESDYLKTSEWVMYSVQSLVDWINGRISWMDKTYVPGTFPLPSQNEEDEVEEYTELPDESTEALEIILDDDSFDNFDDDESSSEDN